MTSKRKNKRRIGILVLGMHRSGTSLLSRLLSLYGCDLPNNLLPANEANSTGYWESTTILEFNNQLLASSGSKWHDWLNFNPRWYHSPRKDEYLHRASSVLKQEFGNSGLFVLKDPRICRLTPFWLEALEQDGITPAIVVPVRHPAMVSRSLTLRDSIQESMGQLLWLRHVLDAEFDSRGLNRTFLTFNQLLEEWHDLQNRMGTDLGIQWPRSNQVSRVEQADFINPEMAHSEIALQNRPASRNMPEAISQAWDVFDKWSRTGESTDDHRLLDGLRDQLNLAGEIAGEAITTGMNTNWLLREKEENLKILNAELNDARIKADEVEAENQVLCEHVESGRKAIDAAEAFSRMAETDRDKLAGHCEKLQTRLATTESNLRQRYAELDHVRHELGTALEAVEHARDAEKNQQRKIADAEKNAEAASAELADARAKLDEIMSTNSRLSQELMLAQQRISLAEAARDEANKRCLGYDRMADTLHMQDIRLARLVEELQNVREQADTAQRKTLGQEHELEAVSEEKRELELMVHSLRAQTDQLQHRLDQQDQAYHFIGQQLFDEKRLAQTTIEQRQWLLSVNTVLLEPGRWWVKFLPTALRYRLLLRRLSRRELFDSETYLGRYQDVARSGMNPLEHYIRHGMQEGRARL